jgi:hypothetical protein
MKSYILLSSCLCLFLFGCVKNEGIGGYQLSFDKSSIILDTVPENNDTIIVKLKLNISGGFDGKGKVFYSTAVDNGTYYSSSSSGIKILNSTNDQITLAVTKYVSEESVVTATLYADGQFGDEAKIFVEFPPAPDTLEIANIVYHDNYSNVYSVDKEGYVVAELLKSSSSSKTKPTVSGDHKFISYVYSGRVYFANFSGKILESYNASASGGFMKGTSNSYYHLEGSSSPHFVVSELEKGSSVKSLFIDIPTSYLGDIENAYLVYNQTEKKYYAAVFVESYYNNNTYDLMYYNGSSWSTIFKERSALGDLKLSPDGKNIAWEEGAQTYQSWVDDKVKLYFTSSKKEGTLVYSSSSYSKFDLNGFDYSPDGSQIVFSVEKGSNSYHKLYVVYSTGGYVSQITSSSKEAYSPYWVD